MQYLPKALCKKVRAFFKSGLDVTTISHATHLLKTVRSRPGMTRW